MAESSKLRNREDVERALETFGRWTLENCRWDREPRQPRYLASHSTLGAVAAQTGGELVAAVEAISEAEKELAEYGLTLSRGNVLSPTSAWWVGKVLEPGGSWANDLEDLLVIVRRQRQAGRLKKPEAPPPAAAPAEPAGLLTPQSDTEAFSPRVLEAAATVPAEGRFGENKVFISHAWRAFKGHWSAGRQEFDEALVEANRNRRLTLVRADLVSAMKPADVAESEVRSFGATFHFIVLPGVGHG